MKIGAHWQKLSIILISFLLLTGFAKSCQVKRQIPPVTELCLIGNKSLQCNDPRLKKPARNYDLILTNAKNYVCTNLDDYKSKKKWDSYMIKELYEYNIGYEALTLKIKKLQDQVQALKTRKK